MLVNVIKSICPGVLNVKGETLEYCHELLVVKFKLRNIKYFLNTQR